MSEYIRTNKFDTNECPNIFVKEKLIRTNVRIYIRDQYIRIFEYSNIFVTLCFKHYDFVFSGQNWGLVAEKRPFLAKIGYMQKWIFLKNISSNFAYIAPKLLSRTIINDDMLLFLHPNYKKFHDERFCHFGQKSTLTG